MPMIKVELSAGCTQDRKRTTAEATTRAMVKHCACTPESVHVVFTDLSNNDWALPCGFCRPRNPRLAVRNRAGANGLAL